ncbi:MAG: AFG1 family ATPase [Betaproteobacteria bacterium]|nr:AFG1 family ATPase [Betaproteobacteria bacterium]MDE2423606.1 AFG1 family ATPase [Betaproteobacteria bacterium]
MNLSDPILPRQAKDPLEWYDHFRQRSDFEFDPDQLRVVEKLQSLHEDLMAFKKYRQTLLAKTFGNKSPPRGLYLYGGVGRGKSALMDAFFETLPYRRKKRVHFHEFMASIQERLGQLQNQKDPLKMVAAEIAVQNRVLCFDEFHVSDIADAMILERLFQNMIHWGVVLVITSNYAPDDLYQDGLQRVRFLPAIDLLKAKLDILNISGTLDHRHRSHELIRNYYSPLSEKVSAQMRRIFQSMCPQNKSIGPEVEIYGRMIPVNGYGDGVIWFEFDALCHGPRSQLDYLEIAQNYHTVLISNIPIMNAFHAEEARRFTMLIDILYDRRIKLIVSAAGRPEELYTEGPFINEFNRTISRLIEMQSVEYLNHNS